MEEKQFCSIEKTLIRKPIICKSVMPVIAVINVQSYEYKFYKRNIDRSVGR